MAPALFAGDRVHAVLARALDGLALIKDTYNTVVLKLAFSIFNVLDREPVFRRDWVVRISRLLW